MTKYRIIIAILLIAGIGMFGYGSIGQSVENKALIDEKYECFRFGGEARDTDVFCREPSKAPEATKSFHPGEFSPEFTTAGFVAIITTLPLWVADRRLKKEASTERIDPTTDKE